LVVRSPKQDLVAGSRKSPIRKTGEAMNRSKKTMPATINDEMK
jgi:hypothetical protein